MRVALCTFAFPDFTVSLARALSARCDAMVFIAQNAAIPDSRFKSIQTFPYSPTMSPWKKLHACQYLMRQVRAFRPHIVHLQGLTPYLIPFLPMVRHVPLVKTLHDPLPHSGEARWSHRIAKILA